MRATTLTVFFKAGKQKIYYNEGSQAAPDRPSGGDWVKIRRMYYLRTALRFPKQNPFLTTLPDFTGLSCW